ncbi:protein of unknown function [Paraburkholderia kururiensis]
MGVPGCEACARLPPEGTSCPGLHGQQPVRAAKSDIVAKTGAAASKGAWHRIAPRPSLPLPPLAPI